MAQLPVRAIAVVAVGKDRLGPAPQMRPPGLAGVDVQLGLDVAQAAEVLGRGRAVQQRHDGAGDHAPTGGQLDRYDRLEVQQQLGVVVQAAAGVEVQLKREADQIGNRILGRLGQACRIGRRAWRRSVGGPRRGLPFLRRVCRRGQAQRRQYARMPRRDTTSAAVRLMSFDASIQQAGHLYRREQPGGVLAPTPRPLSTPA